MLGVATSVIQMVAGRRSGGRGGAPPDLPRRREHHEPDKKDDGTLKKEAQAHLARTPELQLMAELTAKLRELELPWWSADMLRTAWPASQRMVWFRQRPDI